MIVILGLCLILCLALTPIAEASGEKYLYLGVGATHMEEETDISRGNNLWTVRTDTDTGLLINFGGGYRVWENFRIEGEIAYRSSDVDNLELITMNQLHDIVVYERKGDFTSLSFMLNSWYDFDLGDKLKSYVGGGIGIALISLKDIYISNYPLFVPWDEAIFNALYVDDEDWRFAYQGGIGIKYNLSNAFAIDVC